MRTLTENSAIERSDHTLSSIQPQGRSFTGNRRAVTPGGALNSDIGSFCADPGNDLVFEPGDRVRRNAVMPREGALPFESPDGRPPESGTLSNRRKAQQRR